MLQLPPTVRAARLDEVPDYVRDSVIAGESAKIIEGYTFKYNEADEAPFIFFAEINVDNARLWELFTTLLVQLPEQVCLVFHFKDGEPSYSEYSDKHAVLNKLEQFQLEITQDGFLEIGALYSDSNQLEEVFIPSAKYLQYWGNDEMQFRQTMIKFDLFEIPDLDFIDHYPRVTEALRLFYPQVAETDAVMEQLGKIGQLDE